MLRPGGDFLFQVPESVQADPFEPSDEDTFGTRYHRESEVRERLERLGFKWRGCLRRHIPEARPPFDQIRPHVRRPVA